MSDGSAAGPPASGGGRAAVAGRLVVGLLLALLLLWWVLRGTDPGVLLGRLRQASLAGLAAAAALNLGHMVFRVWRWRALLAPVREAIPFRPLFDAVVLGYVATAAVPGRLGELVRPALLSGRERVPFGPCLGSVLVDRLLDGLMVLLLFAIGVLATPLDAEAQRHATLIRGGSVGLVALLTAAFVLLFVLSARRSAVERWVGRRRGLIALGGRVVLGFARGTDAIGRPRLLVRVAVHTLLLWLMIATGTWLGVRACGAEISFGAMLVLLPLLVLGVALPTPAGAGGYHAALTFGLHQLFGVERSVAVTASLLVHLAVTVPLLALGGLLMAAGGLSLGSLREAVRQVARIGSASEPATTASGSRPSDPSNRG